MRIPANIITENKYTIGKEFINRKTHKLYQGYYYELNNKFFAGKEFNNNAPELIKIKSDQVNNLLLTAATYVFGSLSKVKLTDGEIAKKVEKIFDMRPYFIEQRLKLRTPMYSETAAYGHMGRKNEVITKTFKSPDGKSKTMKVELFTWEKLDYVSKVKKEFGLK
jgi:hypothetical protein